MPLAPSIPSLADYLGAVRGQNEPGSGPPVNLVAPFVSGTAVVGEVVSCNGGSWSGEQPITLAYQWTRDTVDIVGATSSTYLLDALDEGADIVCVVTATNGAGSDGASSNTIVPAGAGAEFVPLASDTVLSSDTLLYSEGIAA